MHAGLIQSIKQGSLQIQNPISVSIQFPGKGARHSRGCVRDAGSVQVLCKLIVFSRIRGHLLEKLSGACDQRMIPIFISPGQWKRIFLFLRSVRVVEDQILLIQNCPQDSRIRVLPESPDSCVKIGQPLHLNHSIIIFRILRQPRRNIQDLYLFCIPRFISVIKPVLCHILQLNPAEGGSLFYFINQQRQVCDSESPV